VGDKNQGRGDYLPSVRAGGSLQAFVYSKLSELWMRAVGSHFVLSNFYSLLPASSKSKEQASSELSKLDDSVQMGAISSRMAFWK
jgi:hypothetical protein